MEFFTTTANECVQEEDPRACGAVQVVQLPETIFEGSTSTCVHAVTALKYQFVWTGERISTVRVFAQLSNVTSGAGPLSQALMTEFRSASAEEATPVARSGNPGYQDGLPILTGRVFEQSDGTQNLSRSGVDGRLHLLASTSGLCDNTVYTEAVAFGEAATSGCMQMLAASDFSDCDAMRAAVAAIQANALGSTLPTHVSAYGNPQATEWLGIFRTETNTTGRDGPQVCSQVPAAVLATVLYTPQGTYSNPQMRIVGVQIETLRADWQLSCQSSSCTDLAPFAVTNTVRFEQVAADASLRSSEYRAQCRHRSCAKQAFYPLRRSYFRPGTSNPDSQNQLVTAYGLLLLVIAVFTLGTLFWPRVRSPSV
eukprot:m.108158 g.108158  ORF g.108158 m.108158 type:complete len:368 (-) comp9247_c0_seq1:104-1207(-)